MRIGGRVRRCSRPSRRRWRLASSRVEPETPCTSSRSGPRLADLDDGQDAVVGWSPRLAAGAAAATAPAAAGQRLVVAGIVARPSSPSRHLGGLSARRPRPRPTRRPRSRPLPRPRPRRRRPRRRRAPGLVSSSSSSPAPANASSVCSTRRPRSSSAGQPRPRRTSASPRRPRLDRLVRLVSAAPAPSSATALLVRSRLDGVGALAALAAARPAVRTVGRRPAAPRPLPGGRAPGRLTVGTTALGGRLATAAPPGLSARRRRSPRAPRRAAGHDEDRGRPVPSAGAPARCWMAVAAAARPRRSCLGRARLRCGLRGRGLRGCRPADCRSADAVPPTAVPRRARPLRRPWHRAGECVLLAHWLICADSPDFVRFGRFCGFPALARRRCGLAAGHSSSAGSAVGSLAAASASRRARAFAAFARRRRFGGGRAVVGAIARRLTRARLRFTLRARLNVEHADVLQFWLPRARDAATQGRLMSYEQLAGSASSPGARPIGRGAEVCQLRPVLLGRFYR